MIPGLWWSRLTFQVIGRHSDSRCGLDHAALTIFSIAEKGETLRGVPQVSYEDIGGLQDEIQKVREMI